MVALSSRILSVAESASALYSMVCSLRVMDIATVKVAPCSSLEENLEFETSQYALSLHQFESVSLTN